MGKIRTIIFFSIFGLLFAFNFYTNQLFITLILFTLLILFPIFLKIRRGGISKLIKSDEKENHRINILRDLIIFITLFGSLITLALMLMSSFNKEILKLVQNHLFASFSYFPSMIIILIFFLILLYAIVSLSRHEIVENNTIIKFLIILFTTFFVILLVSILSLLLVTLQSLSGIGGIILENPEVVKSSVQHQQLMRSFSAFYSLILLFFLELTLLPKKASTYIWGWWFR